MCLLKTCSRYQTVYGCCVWYQPFDPKLLNADQTTEAYEEASGMNSLICILSFKVWLAAFLYHLAALICLKAHTIRFYLITHLMHVNEVRSHLLLKNQLTEICSSCTIMTKNCLGKKKKISLLQRASRTRHRQRAETERPSELSKRSPYHPEHPGHDIQWCCVGHRVTFWDGWKCKEKKTRRKEE